MFGLFKKKSSEPPSDGPRPQHRNFTRTVIPDALTRHRSGFLAAISGAQANKTLQESWQMSGMAILPPNQLIPPTGLGVSGFKNDNHLCFLILLPAPKSAGESYFAFITAGPSEDWSPAAREHVPVRYFLLERTASDTTSILEWQPSAGGEEETFKDHGAGPSPQSPPDFIEAIFSRFY